MRFSFLVVGLTLANFAFAHPGGFVVAADKGNTSNGKTALAAIHADIDALAALK